MNSNLKLDKQPLVAVGLTVGFWLSVLISILATRQAQGVSTIWLADGFLAAGFLLLNRSWAVRMAVATSKRRQTARLALAGVGIDHLIEVAAALEDTTRHKPEPDPLLHAAASLGAQPCDCVYVGDATVDVLAARAAGMAAIAVSWGAADREALAATGPDALVDTVADLTAYLLGHDEG